MKGIIKNNNGYILVLALIISILIPVLFLSFISISSNTSKQNEIIEGTFQAQAVAEMGATFFQHAMTNEIEKQKQSIVNSVTSAKRTDIAAKIYNTDDYYINLAISEMQTRLKVVLDSLKLTPEKPIVGPEINKKIEMNNNNFFEVTATNQPDYFSNNAKELEIKFTSTGYDELKQAEIRGKIEVDFSNIFGAGGSKFTIPTYNSIPDPGVISNICEKGKKANLTGIKCQVNGSINYENDLTVGNTILRVTDTLEVKNFNNGNSNSTIYVLNQMIGKNMNNMNNLKLHVGGNFEAKNMNGGGITKSTIEVGGEAKITSNIKLSASTLYINGYTEIDKIISMYDSTIYIDNNAKIEKGVTLNTNANICVNGHLEISDVKNNSGGTGGVYALSSSNKNVTTDSTAFNTACSGGAIPGKIIYNTDYDYSY